MLDIVSPSNTTPNPKHKNLGMGRPMWKTPKEDASWLFNDLGNHSSACQALIESNDDCMPEDVREKNIQAIFANHGVEVEFVG
jgi:hypothetical protein